MTGRDMLHTSTPKLDPREQHYWIAAPQKGLKLFLRHLAPANGRSHPHPVLYVHGATFPSALSIAHRFDGFSWRDALGEAGFDVWGFDFLGFGASDRYPEMNAPADANQPLCCTQDASEQLEAAVRFILAQHGVPRLSLITHSWGSMPAGRLAARLPDLVDRLVLFGPITQRPPRRDEKPPAVPAWRVVTLTDQWERFVEDVPASEPPVLDRAHFADWGERYLDSDREARQRKPPSVKIPSGPYADILVAWHGELTYDPAAIRLPVAIIRGAWDGLVTDNDARWLFDAFTTAPEKRDIKISRGTHLMHLETMRHALYAESIAFLRGEDHHRKQQQGRATAMDVINEKPDIPGYDRGTEKVAKSPIALAEWEDIKKSALFSEEDAVYLRLSEGVLADQVDDLLKTWRGIIADHPHLRAYNEDQRTHEVDTDYTAAVAKRFHQWVLDTARANYDQAWLDYQYEIGLRHHRTKKNETDHAYTLGHIRARDVIAFCASIVVPMRAFLSKGGHPPEVVERMYDAWWKAMILQATLWMQPYIRDGDF
jgi:pimeloyl-ACP methyl ester carboxylesterase